MAATSDKDMLSTLTSTNAALAGQLATKDRLIANLQAQIRNAATNTNTNRPNTQTNSNYCWSHFTRVLRNHKSQNCQYPKDGHKKEAARENKMGGKDA
jgi:hypothetical protein